VLRYYICIKVYSLLIGTMILQDVSAIRVDSWIEIDDVARSRGLESGIGLFRFRF
jgi:hypothetical protein